jgi:hypothetical protein
VGDELVLLHLERGEMFTLSSTGARAWDLFSEGRARADVEAALADEFDVERSRVRPELEALVASLEQERLIEPAA